MLNLTLVFGLLLVLFLALLGGLIARKLRQPTILGYLLAGTTIGWFVVSAVKGQEALMTVAELGVALLMFSLGLEFSFTQLNKIKKIVFWGVTIQILTVVFWGIILLPGLGLDFYSALFISSCFSLSSTAIVTKILMERGEIDSIPGELMIGWLLVQDLAVLPLILILPKIPILTGANFTELIMAFGKSFSLLIAIFLFGKAIVPKIIDRIVAVNSREILILGVVTLCLSAAFGTYALGLSFALGAFLAGLIISGSSKNHAIFSEIRPLKDIFSIIFFVSMGTMLPPSFLISNLASILSLSAGVILVKFIIVFALVLYFGYHSKIAFLVGISLVQVGEFSFILAQSGLSQGLISSSVYSTIISVAILTIMVTPLLMSKGGKVYSQLRKVASNHFPKIYSFFFARLDRRPVQEEIPLKDHIVICGYGRVGGWLGRALMLCQVPFVVVDYNHEVVEELKDRGIPVVFGDPSDIDVLDYAQVDLARTIVIAIPDRLTQQMVISNALNLNPKIDIICRTHHQEDQVRLKALGVKTIVHPEFEASLTIIHRLLQNSGLSTEEVSGKIKRIRIEHAL